MTFFPRITSPTYAVPCGAADAALADGAGVPWARAASALTARAADAPAVAIDAIKKSRRPRPSSGLSCMMESSRSRDGTLDNGRHIGRKIPHDLRQRVCCYSDQVASQ